MERREVTIGKHNAHHVEVSSGLEEGDRILLYDPRDGDVRSAGEQDEDDSESPADSLMPTADVE